MRNKTMKNLFIRCSQETYDLAHAIAKKESRSLNKQIIHMIHKEADDKGIVLDKDTKDVKPIVSDIVSVGLSGLVGTTSKDFQD